jgi:8-oxo-dGTP pyrophosphatase MutT (NUDIX family)
MSAIRPAATVVLLRHRPNGFEVLLLQRNSALQFAGGLWVFPGGRIDNEDFGNGSRDLLAAARCAAIRETREETGLDIAHCALHYFAHWTTPEAEPKRYATWFFIASIELDRDVVVDGSEILSHRWLTPVDAIAAHREGDLDLLPPTYIALEELSTCTTIDDVLQMYRDRRVIEILPKFVKTAVGAVALYPGDAGYKNSDPLLPGKRHRTTRDKNGWCYECDV